MKYNIIFCIYTYLNSFCIYLYLYLYNMFLHIKTNKYIYIYVQPIKICAAMVIIFPSDRTEFQLECG